MKLVSYDDGDWPRAGLAVGTFVADMAKSSKALGKSKLPDDVWELLAWGAGALSAAEKLNAKLLKLAKRVEAKKEKRPKWLVPLDRVHLGPPVEHPQKIICIGKNYRDHVKEQEATAGKKLEPPGEPIFFTKFPTTLNGPYDPIPFPTEGVTEKVDFEAELALVIGAPLKAVTPEAALQAVAGYMVMNDVSARDCQTRDGQWSRAKSFDGFGPCGPWIVSPAELAAAGLDPQKLKLWSILNGQKMQDGITADMIHSIGKIIAHIAKGITLMPGDIISTGTPAGVGAFREPPIFMKPGDVIECGIDGIGSIRNVCE